MATVAADPYVADVRKLWDDTDKTLAVARRKAYINRCFYLGHQHILLDNAGVLRTLRELAPQSDRVKATLNILGPRIRTVKGRMLSRPLAFENRPYGADDGSRTAAHLGEVIIADAADRQRWGLVRAETLDNTILDGTAAVSIEWDPFAGKAVYQDPQMGNINEGDIALTPWSFSEFSVQAGARRWNEAQEWVGCRMMPPEQAREMYRLDYTPAAGGLGIHSAVQKSLAGAMGTGDLDECCEVFVHYKLPSQENPEGVHAVVVGNKTVYAGPWPFPFTDRLNLYVFRQTEANGRWWGHTYVNDAIPVQVAYNHIRSCIHEHAKLCANARLVVPYGTLSDSTELTDRPGDVLEYYPEAGQAPMYLSPPQLPRWLTGEMDRLEHEMDDITHAHAVSRGQATGDRMSGYAVAQISERNDTPLSDTARDQADGWGALASMALELYQANVVFPRDAGIDLGDGVPMSIRWVGKQLLGQTRMHVPIDSTMPQSRAALIAQMSSLRQQFPEAFVGVSPAQWGKIIDMPTRVLDDAMDPDERLAQQENHLMLAGEVAVPQTFHDHARHMDCHNNERLTAAYTNADPEVKRTIDMHIAAHHKLLLEEVVRKIEVDAAMPGLGSMPSPDRPAGSARPAPTGPVGAPPTQGEPER